MLGSYGPQGPGVQYYSDMEFDDYYLTDEQKHSGEVIRIDARPRYDCSPDEPMELYRNQKLTVHAWGEDDHGQLQWLGADSIEVDPYPEPDNMPVMYPDQYEYLGSYPSNLTGDDWWTDNLQGVTTDGEYWYFTQTEWELIGPEIPKVRIFSIQDDLGSDSPRNTVDLRGLLGDVQEFDHVGDISYYEYQGTGYLIMGLDMQGQDLGICAVMRVYHHNIYCPDIGLAAWTYMDHNTKAPWIAVDSEGDIYTSNSSITSSDGMKKYRVDWDMISESYQEQRDFLEYDGEIFPVDESGQQMEILTVQGGVFSPRGHLFYLVNGYSSSGDGQPSEDECRIRVFKTDGWRLHRQSVNNDHDVFRFEINHDDLNFGSMDEPEGLTYVDLSDETGAEPEQIHSYLHVIVIDNDIDTDDLYFKHYTVSEREKCKL